jgi:cob(I)alamin adenosyltransferase
LRIEEIFNTLTDIQHRLQDINSILSSHSDKSFPHLHRLLLNKTDSLEEEIDSLTSTLSPLRNFIIPSGGLAASHLHLSRAICRRAERSLCLYQQQQQQQLKDNKSDLKSAEIYLNRLSDYLFTAARFCAKIEGNTEIIYSSRTIPK